jgi:sterol desaturase/sphingolipid hydroxylase (fatty acid hydroxylase superfamily)
VTEPTVWAIPVFFASMAVEAFVLARRGESYEKKDVLASLSGGVGSLVVKIPFKALSFAISLVLWEHRLFDIRMGVAGWVMLILAEDLCYYWFHRTCHEVRVFWATHIVHHSSERYTLSTALRQSWTAPLAGLAFWLPLPLLGFRPEHVLLMNSFSLLYQYWIHTETIGKLGPIEWIFNTPSHHRVHHGSNPQYLDRNHGGILIIWDRLFGTFEPEGERVVYGLTKNVGSFHPVTIQFHELADVVRDVRASRTLMGALHAIFRSPGSAPHPELRERSTPIPTARPTQPHPHPRSTTSPGPAARAASPAAP